MEDLAWQFPAEAVERAACRFCEAIARWRGKPELETVSSALSIFTISHFDVLFIRSVQEGDLVDTEPEG